MYDLQSLHDACSEYKHKSKVLRQIHSNKLKISRRRENILNVSTIIVALLTTFMSFFGIEKIHEILFSSIDFQVLSLSYNLVVLLLLIVSFLQFSTRLSETKNTHLNSVKRLSSLITDIDDILRIKSCSDSEINNLINSMNLKYKQIIDYLPDSSDSEWRNAKKALSIKDAE